jgi:prevent-host-death family protein
MKTIGAFDAKTHLGELLERVASGESFLITKHGKPVAALSPAAAGSRFGPRDVVTAFRREFAKSLTAITAEEIRDLKEAGRK